MNKNECDDTAVSVCCVSFNHGKYIKETLSSIVSQKTKFRYEVIIFDDCSTDDSRAIIDDYKREYPDIIKVVYPRENIYSRGYTPFYNVINKSIGRYIAFCECDDYWTDNLKLQKQYDALEKNDDVDLCFHPSYTLRDSSISNKKYGYYGDSEAKHSSKNIIKVSGGYMGMASIFVRRSAFEQFIGKYSDFFQKSMWHSTIQIISSLRGGALYIPTYMNVYRSMHAGSWTKQTNESIEIQLSHLRMGMERNRFLKKVCPKKYRDSFDYNLNKKILNLFLSKKIPAKRKDVFLKSIKCMLPLKLYYFWLVVINTFRRPYIRISKK